MSCARRMMAPPIRVLVLDQARGVWGAQRYVLRLAPLMRELGVELTLAGPSSLELHDVWRDAGFEAINLDLPVGRSIRNAGRPALSGVAREVRAGVRAAKSVARVVEDGGYDVVWANAHWTHLDASLAGRICRRPVVLHLHEEAMAGVGRWLRAAAVRIAADTVAVSSAVAANLPQLVRGRVSVIPNGIDTDAMSPATAADDMNVRDVRSSLGVGDEHVMVLAATRLDPTKRIEDLLDVVARLDDPQIRLVVAGATSEYPDYERRVRILSASLPSGRVTFCGNRSDMAWLFRASDVVIHAGVVEGMPLGLLEAQACGKPVVAYRVAGVPEAVLDGSTGLLAEPCDIVALSEALRRLVGSTLLRRQLGAGARAHVLTHHRIGLQVAENVALLRDLTGRSGTR
jgi:glycosyltransferase involved in cell wall biosynthesis